MSESSNEKVNDRAIVIQRNGELNEFVSLIDELAVPSEIFSEAMPTAEQVAGGAVVIVPGSRLIETGTPNLSLWPRTIAVIDDSSKTLVAHLNRIGVSLVVRRPIHPRTLRLLLLHEIYRGPERRRKKRILIGHPVRIGAGLFKHRGTLLELSTSGARIELPNAPKIGSTLKILIGKDLTLAKPLKLHAKVVRCIRPSGSNGRREAEIGVAITNASKEAKAIAAILDRFAAGPAAWEGKLKTGGAQTAATAEVTQPIVTPPTPNAETTEEIDPNDSARRLPPSFSVRPSEPDAPAAEAAPACETVESPPSAEMDAAVAIAEEPTAAPAEKTAPDSSAVAKGDERRRDPRIPYDRRVVALGEEAARVLVGRDLSQGGMRIATNETVDIGDTLRVALHCGTELEPLVVLATAQRHDDNDGTVLSFQDLSGGQKDHLEKIIASSSPIQAHEQDPGETMSGAPVVLGEMIETVSKAPLNLDENIETEDQIEAHLDSIFDAGESI